MQCVTQRVHELAHGRRCGKVAGGGDAGRTGDCRGGHGVACRSLVCDRHAIECRTIGAGLAFDAARRGPPLQGPAIDAELRCGVAGR